MATHSCVSRKLKTSEREIWQSYSENNSWCGLQPVSEATGWQEAVGMSGYRGPAVTGDGRVGVTRYDSPCLHVSHEFRLADQGRQDRCSQPSVSCHTRSEHKTKYGNRKTSPAPVRGTRRLHASAFSSCTWSLTPPPPPVLSLRAGRKWCGAEFNFSIISIILAVMG